jgi:hypothetical protein
VTQDLSIALQPNILIHVLHVLTLAAAAAPAGAVAAANAAATRRLKQLTRELAASTTQLAAAVQLSDLLTALLYHSRAATAGGWSVPCVGLQEQQQYLAQQQQQQQQQQLGSGQLPQQQGTRSSSDSDSDSDSSSRGLFQLQGLWPFWMVGSDSSTVKNDVALDGFMLLTGPNMAGEQAHMQACSGNRGYACFSSVF